MDVQVMQKVEAIAAALNMDKAAVIRQLLHYALKLPSIFDFYPPEKILNANQPT